MKISSNTALDSNILVFAYNTQSKHHHTARQLITKAQKQPGYFTIAPQNALEFYATITRGNFQPKPANKKLALQMMENYLFSDIFQVATPNTETMFIFHKIYQKTRLKSGSHIFNLFLAATLLSHNITTLYTQNVKDFQDIPDFKATNPFAE